MLNIYGSETPVAGEIKSLWNQCQANQDKAYFYDCLKTLDSLSFVLDESVQHFWQSSRDEHHIHMLAQSVEYWEKARKLTNAEVLDSGPQ
jgi:hypothetical protein